jgi:hypothetical protein
LSTSASIPIPIPIPITKTESTLEVFKEILFCASSEENLIEIVNIDALYEYLDDEFKDLLETIDKITFNNFLLKKDVNTRTYVPPTQYDLTMSSFLEKIDKEFSRRILNYICISILLYLTKRVIADYLPPMPFNIIWDADCGMVCEQSYNQEKIIFTIKCKEDPELKELSERVNHLQ